MRAGEGPGVLLWLKPPHRELETPHINTFPPLMERTAQRGKGKEVYSDGGNIIALHSKGVSGLRPEGRAGSLPAGQVAEDSDARRLRA